MKFTKDSELLMVAFMNDFSTFLPKHKPQQQKHMDIILKIFYNEIKHADKFISLLWSLKKIKYKIHEISEFSAMPKSVLFNSNYIPEANKNYIIDNIKGYLSYHTTVIDRKIIIYFAILSDADFNNINRFHDYVNRMLIWIKLAISYSSRHCGKQLTTFCYLTPLQKKLPLHQYNVIGAENCNSAVTTSCIEKGEICIFRKEEVMKVFIHETFHILGLDFSNMTAVNLNIKIGKLFPINSQYNLHEAYSEFWASIMNALFSAYFLIDDKTDINDFILYSEFCMQFEQIFSLFQCVKVLDFMGMQYINLFGTDQISQNVRKYLYKENTNVFAYYIIKTLLLYYNYEFMVWCKKYNTNILCFHKSTENLNRFYQFIKNHYKKKQFIVDLGNVHKKLCNIKEKKTNKEYTILNRTMRMSISELD